MTVLFTELGINWKLLLTQGVNFFVLLGALTVFAYRPLLAVMAERRRRIEEGLRNAARAEQRLAEVEREGASRIAAADTQAIQIVHAAERDANRRAEAIVAQGRERGIRAVKDAEVEAEHQRREALARLHEESAGLIRAALAKTVELDPDAVDERLIAEATRALAGPESAL